MMPQRMAVGQPGPKITGNQIRPSAWGVPAILMSICSFEGTSSAVTWSPALHRGGGEGCIADENAFCKTVRIMILMGHLPQGQYAILFHRGPDGR